MESTFNRYQDFDGVDGIERNHSALRAAQRAAHFLLDHVTQEPFPAMSDHFRPESYGEVADGLTQQLQFDHEQSSGNW